MADDLPNVGRPRGGEWRRLQSEGIIWEGQILITGDDVDLAALLVVTPYRLAFIRGGSVALDIDREWLSPEPVLRRTGTILVWLTEDATGSTETIGIIVRSGREDAARLVSLLTRNEESWAALPALNAIIPEPNRDNSPFAYARSLDDQDSGFTDDDFAPSPTDEIVPVFSVLDDDDFPPIEDRPSSAETWAEPVETDQPAPQAMAVAAPPSEPDGPLAPISGFDSRLTRERRSWVIRLSGLMVLFALMAGFSSGLIPGWNDLRDAASPPPPSIVAVADFQDPTTTPSAVPTKTNVAEPTRTIPPTSTSSSESLAGNQDPTTVPQETAFALGVGSDQGDPDDAVETLEPTAPPEPTATLKPPATSTTEPTIVPTETNTPAPTPTRQPTQTPSTSNTVDDVGAASLGLQDDPTPSQTATSNTTPVIPTPIPTNGSDIPTETPDLPPTASAETPTQEVVVQEPTEDIEEGATGPSSLLSEQPSTLDAGESPRQTFAVGGVRIAIDEAIRGDSVPDLTLGPLTDAEWVVLLVSADNWSSDQQDLVLADFRLISLSDPANEFPLDSATGGVASFLAFSPTLTASDTATVSAGGSQQMALVYIVPAGIDDLALVTGDQTVDLATTFSSPHSDGSLDFESAAAPLASGTVVEVLDGRTIVVDSEGVLTTVQYAGVGVPGDGACYSAEAQSANSDLVFGQTVYLERERRNRVSSDIYLRDVWIMADDGTRSHVGALLTRSGNVTAEPVSPDTRFAGWIAGENDIAEQNGVGIWSTCSG